MLAVAKESSRLEGLGVEDLRKLNLRALIAKYGGPGVLAKKLGYANGSYFSQMIGPRPIRPLNEKTCRRWEVQLGLPAKWMDEDHSRREGVNEEPASYTVAPRGALDSELLARVAQAIENAGLPYAASKFGEVVTLVYEDATAKGGAIDEQYLVRVLRLAK